MTSLQYSPAYPPGIDIDPAYKSFLSNFYRLSDTPNAHEAYAAQFADDATFIMASRKAVGSEGACMQPSKWDCCA